jgi:hypothetical protein
MRALSRPVGESDIAELVNRVRAHVDLDKVQGNLEKLGSFDVAAARMLFDLTVGAARDAGLLEGISHLIFVPDYTLQSLPPHLLRDANGHCVNGGAKSCQAGGVIAGHDIG